MCAVRSFQEDTHVNQLVPDAFVNLPFPIESFLHLHAQHTKYPTSGQKYALEFDIKFAGATGIAFNLSTLIICGSLCELERGYWQN